MMSDDPLQEPPEESLPSIDEMLEVRDDDAADRTAPSDGLQAYNIVSDTLVGFNFRLSDNCFQGIFILVSVVLGAGIGALFGGAPGLFVGGFAGLVGGLILSGIVLMIYRAVRHAKGKHD